MYSKRIKIFIIFCSLLLLVCLLRLAQMQIMGFSSVQNEIEELKQRGGQSQQLKTIRGKILDRKGRELAVDEPRFWVHIDYMELSYFLDERVQQGKLLRASKKSNPEKEITETKQEIQDKLIDLEQVIYKCAQFKDVNPSEIRDEIKKINDLLWDRRAFQAWRVNFPDSEVYNSYDNKLSIPISEAIKDFEFQEPNSIKRIELVNNIEIAEMYKKWPLVELKTDDAIFTAQLEFKDINGIEILAKAQRVYPYGSVAAQTIGWVGPATQLKDKELFADDRLLSYLEDDVCGKMDGVEYVCEAYLRGRRGEEQYDIDRQLISRTERNVGGDVVLTLDIELQKRIEEYLVDYNHDVGSDPNIAAVVLDVSTGDILALVSIPVYDLNRARYDYGKLINDPGKPLINRAINARYPPGSVIKPLILIAGMETGHITADEIISCPSHAPPVGWPRCLIFRNYGVGHDTKWENTARNAIKGSCNIYFSHLADRIETGVLQQWLYNFGFGRNILSAPKIIDDPEFQRNMGQLQGIISSTIPESGNPELEQMPALSKNEKKFFGIGQGNLRVTPLQVANEMAVIARDGIYKSPRLFKDPSQTEEEEINLGISPETLAVIYDGMSAVVNETGGTAYKEFSNVISTFAQQDVKVYGKTGSTEAPEHAWFAGFAEEKGGRKLALAVIVEGGQHGSSDAAPLIRDILQFCIQAGYIGRPLNSFQ